MTIQRYTGENVEFHATGDLVSYEDYAELKEEYERLDKSHSAALAKIDRLEQGTPDLRTMMAALDAFFADEDVPERAMLTAYDILRGKSEVQS